MQLLKTFGWRERGKIQKVHKATFAGIGVGLSAIGLGTSLAQQYGGDNDSGSVGQFGPTTVTYPQYSFTEPRRQLMSDYVSSGLQNLSEGKYPTYWEKAYPGIRAKMRKNLYGTYYGDTSGTGLLDQARSTGAALGVGPKSVIGRENKLLKQYADQEAEIDQYLEQLGLGAAQQAESTYLNVGNAIVGGPESTVIGGGSYQIPGATDYGSQIAGASGDMLTNLKDWWRTRKTPTTESGWFNYNSPLASYGGSNFGSSLNNSFWLSE